MEKTEKSLYAGVGRQDITPPVGGNLFGYRPDVFSKSVNDPLSATALALAGPDTKILIISATVCIVSTKLADELKKLISGAADIKEENILICATHTHSGPNTCGMTGWGDIDKKYCEDIFIPKIVDSAKTAVSGMKPATAGVNSVCSRAGMNRRQQNSDGSISLGQNPWGIYDPNMTVLSFKDSNGAAIASVVHYGAHCTAAGMNTEISRDWAGVMTDRLEAETGAPALFLNGSEGDVGPRLSNGCTTGDISYIYETGGIAALDVLTAFRGIKSYSGVCLSAVSGELVLPLSERTPLANAKEILKKIGGETINISGQKARYYADVIKSYEEGIHEEKNLILPQTVISVGDVALVPFRFEFFSEISLRMRKYSPFTHTLCLGVTNGDGSYLPSQDQICRGGYEVDVFKTARVFPLADNTDDNIIHENLKLLELLKNKK